MRAFALSLVIGIVVGALYGILRVRSPAPPAIALLGLLGMLVGERLVPLARKHLLGIADQPVASQPAAARPPAPTLPE